jgi:beta-glucosidase
LADVLFGLQSPSGRLPLTLPNIENEVRFTPEQYPGVDRDGSLETDYSEALEVGYRWYDANGVVPRFPFGFGLSYSTFEYADLRVASRGSGWEVSFTLSNTGGVSATETPQLYVGFPASAGEPPKILKGFQKVSLNPGENEQVSFELVAKDLSIFQVTSRSWELQRGEFDMMVGSSAGHIHLSLSVVFDEAGSSSSSDGLTDGAIAGIAVATVAGAAIVTGLFLASRGQMTTGGDDKKEPLV